MKDMLEAIIQAKREEVEILREQVGQDPYHPFHEILQTEKENPRRFEKGLKEKGLSVIAEIKRQSPSAGKIGNVEMPTELAQKYEKGGAAAISVLTDEKSFGGHLDDLKAVAKTCQVPLLRKEFIIDPLQIAEAVHAGASAVLLIVKTLKEQTAEFIQAAEKMGVDAFVEINTEEELEIAVNAGARIIGVNNRDLTTFEVDISRAEKLIPKLPKECVKVAASGVRSVEDAHRMRAAGYDAILIGEALVRSEDPTLLIQEMRAES